MGRLYDKYYHFAGSGTEAGSMVCAACGKKISSTKEDWLESKRTTKGDWAFVVFHRACTSNQKGWETLAKEKEDYELKVVTCLNKLAELALDSAIFEESLSRMGFVEE